MCPQFSKKNLQHCPKIFLPKCFVFFNIVQKVKKSGGKNVSPHGKWKSQKNTDRNGEKNGKRKKTKCPLQTNTVLGGRFHLNNNANLNCLLHEMFFFLAAGFFLAGFFGFLKIQASEVVRQYHSKSKHARACLFQKGRSRDLLIFQRESAFCLFRFHLVWLKKGKRKKPQILEKDKNRTLFKIWRDRKICLFQKDKPGHACFYYDIGARPPRPGFLKIQKIQPRKIQKIQPRKYLLPRATACGVNIAARPHSFVVGLFFPSLFRVFCTSFWVFPTTPYRVGTHFLHRIFSPFGQC